MYHCIYLYDIIIITYSFILIILVLLCYSIWKQINIKEIFKNVNTTDNVLSKSKTIKNGRYGISIDSREWPSLLSRFNYQCLYPTME